MKWKNYKSLVTVTILFATACNSQNQKSAIGYKLEKPVKIELPKQVDQISGIVYSNDNSVYAIDDDNSTLYKISLQQQPKIENWQFDKGNDYEDVVMLNNRFYVLNSNGDLQSIALPVTQTERFTTTLKGKNEFETLVFDPATKGLIMICKECSEDKKGETSAYAFDIRSNSVNTTPLFKIDRKEIESKLGKEIERFKPSSAAINPLTKELFVLSSVNKLIVVLDPARKVKAAYSLEGKLFKQPEGITFTPTGDMLIANEGSSKIPANILIFKKQ